VHLVIFANIITEHVRSSILSRMTHTKTHDGKLSSPYRTTYSILLTDFFSNFSFHASGIQRHAWSDLSRFYITLFYMTRFFGVNTHDAEVQFAVSNSNISRCSPYHSSGTDGSLCQARGMHALHGNPPFASADFFYPIDSSTARSAYEWLQENSARARCVYLSAFRITTVFFWKKVYILQCIKCRTNI
jgi:hypothetical protein